MSICVALVDGVITQASASCDLMVLTKDEVTQLVNSQFDYSLLQFDEAVFRLLLQNMLVTFIVGHVLGRVLKSLGKR